MASLTVNPVLCVMSFSPRNSNSNSPPLHLQSNVQNRITITPNNQSTFSSGEKIIEITPGSYRNDTNKKYNPEIANVTIGTKVTWLNSDGNNIPFPNHSIISGDPDKGPTADFHSGLIEPGQNFSHTFDKQGVFEYYDPNYRHMKGKIIVDSVENGAGQSQLNMTGNKAIPSSLPVIPSNVTGNAASVVHPENITSNKVNLSISASNKTETISNVTTSSSNSFLTYENNTYGMKMNYPSDWQLENATSLRSMSAGSITTITGFTPQHTDGGILVVEVQDLIDTSITLQQILDERINAYKNKDGFRIVEASTSATLANQSAYLLVYTYTSNDNNNDTFKEKEVREVGTIVGNKVFFIMYLTNLEIYYTFLPAVDKMIDSFQIINSTNITSESNNMIENSNVLIPQQYNNSKYQVSIMYPSDWTAEEGDNDLAASGDNNIVTLVPSNGTDNRGPSYYHTFLAINIGKPTDTDLNTYLADTIDNYSSSKDFSVVESNTNATLSGQPAYVLVWTDSEGFDKKSMEIGAIIGGQAYYVDYQSDPDTYDDNLPIINKMLSSLQLPPNSSGFESQDSDLSSSSNGPENLLDEMP
jgi:plastocyanin